MLTATESLLFRSFSFGHSVKEMYEFEYVMELVVAAVNRESQNITRLKNDCNLIG